MRDLRPIDFGPINTRGPGPPKGRTWTRAVGEGRDPRWPQGRSPRLYGYGRGNHTFVPDPTLLPLSVRERGRSGGRGVDRHPRSLQRGGESPNCPRDPCPPLRVVSSGGVAFGGGRAGPGLPSPFTPRPIPVTPRVGVVTHPRGKVPPPSFPKRVDGNDCVQVPVQTTDSPTRPDPSSHHDPFVTRRWVLFSGHALSCPVTTPDTVPFLGDNRAYLVGVPTLLPPRRPGRYGSGLGTRPVGPP